MRRPTQGIIAFPILLASLADHTFPFLDHVYVLIDFAHSWLCGAGFVGFRRRGRRRSGPCRKRSRLVRAFIACANRPVRWRQLLLHRRVERPRLVSVRQRVERWLWLDRPLQPQHLWRLRDPAPSSQWRGRFPSPGAEPRLPRPGAASAARRPRRSGGSYFRRRPRLAALWRWRRGRLA